MTLDEKTKCATFRVNRLSRKLRCCSCLFSCYGMGFFLSAVSTIASARWNSSFIAQTGYMPWTHPIKDFTPSEEAAKGEFSLYDNFLKMGVLSLLLAFVMMNFVMRTAIARWCNKEEVSHRAFRRTFYCIAAFGICYYFLHGQSNQFMELYKDIAQDKNVTVEFGHRNLKAFDTMRNSFGIDDMLDHFNVTQKPEVPQRKHKRHHWQKKAAAKPRHQETPEEMAERDNFVKTWAPKLFPYVKEYEIAHGIRDADASDEEEFDMPEKKSHGMCPVFVVIIISMIGQLVVLKMHERSLRHLKTLKRAKEIVQEQNTAQNQVVDTEAQPQYVPCPVVTEETTIDDKADFDYSIEEPASPEDKSGSDIVFSFSDKDIKISGINQSSGSITISNNME